MNKKTISLKVDDFTITLHRGEEEPKEIEQKRVALYVTCLYNLMMKPMVEYYEEYHPELKTDVENIIHKFNHTLHLYLINKFYHKKLIYLIYRLLPTIKNNLITTS